MFDEDFDVNNQNNKNNEEENVIHVEEIIGYQEYFNETEKETKYNINNSNKQQKKLPPFKIEQKQNNLPLLPNETTQIHTDFLTLQTATSEFTLNWLNSLYNNQLHIRQQLSTIQTLQSSLFTNPTQNLYQQISSLFLPLQKQINSNLNNLNYIDSTCLVNPFEMERFDWLLQELRNESSQLDLFINEYKLLSQKQPSFLCKLQIIVQPFPCVVVKEKPTGPIIVQILFGSSVKLVEEKDIKIKASIIFPPKSKLKENEFFPVNPSQQIDKNSFTCVFVPKFAKGSKMQFVKFKFSTTLKLQSLDGKIKEVFVESENSEEFLVLTNEAQQWINSEKTFIEKMLFENKDKKTTWFKFVNRLQKQVLVATKQNGENYKRFLTVHEISYIHSTYFECSDSFSLSLFDVFWNQAGKCIRSLRFSWNVCPLWLEGFFFGFISKKVAEEIVNGQKQGTFLLRWSESTGGIDCVYATGDNEKPVRHCLFNFPAKTNISDWLRENVPLTNFFRVVPTVFYTQFQVVSVHKDQMLSPFYSKRPTRPESKHEGYDDEVFVIEIPSLLFNLTSNNYSSNDSSSFYPNQDMDI